MNPGGDLEGDVVAVTGAGRGLGREYALHLAVLGASIVLNDADTAAARATAASIERQGGRATVVTGSVSDVDVCEEIVSTAVSRFGRLDALVHGGGRLGDDDLMCAKDEDVRSALAGRVLGALWITRAALLAMRREGAGRIVVSTSGTGAFGVPRAAVAAAVDAALIGLTRALALDVEDTSIRVNAIAPIADTDPADRALRRFRLADRSRYTTSAVAGVVSYLCHRDCPLNGAVLSVGGGRIARIATITAAGHFDEDPQLDRIARKLDAIVSIDHAIEPRSALDELLLIEV